jgi:hypothetical protein
MYVDNIVTVMKGLINPPTGEEIIAAGYNTLGDGGGGTFIWVPGTPTDDGGINIKNNAATGHFKRLFSGTINARWFGTFGNGVDDQPHLQSAIDYCLAKNINLHLDDNFTIGKSLNINRQVNSVTASDFFIISGGGIHTDATIPLFSTSLNSTPVNRPVTQLVRFREITFTSVKTTESYVLDGNKYLRTTFDGCSFFGIKLLTTNYYTQSIYLLNCNARDWIGVFINTAGCYDLRISHGLYESGESFASLIGSIDVNGHGVNATITNNVIEGMSGYAIKYKFSSVLTVGYNYFEENKLGDLLGADNNNINNPNRGVIHIGNFHFMNVLVQGFYPVTWGATKGGISLGNSSNSNLNYFTTSVSEVFTANVASWERANVATHFGADKIFFGTSPALNGAVTNYATKIDKGTIVLNTEISATNPNTGWICIVTGTYSTAQWKPFGTTNGLTENRGAVLVGSEDLNSMMISGNYFPVPNVGWLTTGLNYPIKDRGILEIIQESKLTLDIVQKYATIVDNPTKDVRIFYRTYYGYGHYWSRWREMVTI